MKRSTFSCRPRPHLIHWVKAWLLTEQAESSEKDLGLFVENRTAGTVRTGACLFLCGLFGCFGMGAVELTMGVEVRLGLGVQVGLVGEVTIVVVVGVRILLEVVVVTLEIVVALVRVEEVVLVVLAVELVEVVEVVAVEVEVGVIIDVEVIKTPGDKTPKEF